MSWRGWLALDLSGRLASWRRKYRDDVREFDHRDVWCTVTSWWDGRCFTVSATARCNDPHVEDGGWAKFYSAPDAFLSRVEADAHIEAEIRRSTEAHTNTRFHRRTLCRVIEGGRLSDQPLTIFEFCQGGQWHQEHPEEPGRLCPECGSVSAGAGLTCPRCGGLLA